MAKLCIGLAALWLGAAAVSCTFPEYLGFTTADAGGSGTNIADASADGPLSCAASAAGCSVAACNDRMKDGDETDIDCGGPCTPCGAAKACRQPADCLSGACVGSACTAP